MTEQTSERVIEAARERGLDVVVVQRDQPAGSVAEAAAVLGIGLDQIVKTLVVKRHDDSFLFALVPGDRIISWPKLRAVVGVNKLRLPDPDIAFAATGYVRGTIVPIGSTVAWPVFADTSIVGKRIALGGGTPGASLFVDADALIGAYDATVADITELVA